MAGGLLDLLMGKGEYMDPNKVLNRRMVDAGLQPAPQSPEVAQAQAAAMGGTPGAAAPGSMAEIMAKINQARQAQAQAQAAQALQQTGGQVLPARQPYIIK